MVEDVPRSPGMLQAMPHIVKGDLVVPEAFGLGLSLDEDAVRRYTVR